MVLKNRFFQKFILLLFAIHFQILLGCIRKLPSVLIYYPIFVLRLIKIE